MSLLNVHSDKIHDTYDCLSVDVITGFFSVLQAAAHRSHRLNAAEEKEKWVNNQMGKVKLERQRGGIPLFLCVNAVPPLLSPFLCHPFKDP